MNNQENSVMAIAAWKNSHATKHVLSIMFEQKFEYTNFLSFKLGKSSRRVVVESFPEAVAEKFGLNFNDLEEGFNNATKLDLNLNELTHLPMRITLLEITDEKIATEQYYRPKTFGEGGAQLITPDGELIYHKLSLTEGNADQILQYLPASAMVPVESASLTEKVKTVF